MNKTPRIDRAEAIEPIDVHVAHRVRTGREQRGWSRPQLAAAIGLSEQQVSKWERGANRLYVNRLWAIANALGLQIPYFFDGFMAGSVALSQARAADGANAEQISGLMTIENIHLLSAYETLSEKRKRLVRQLIAELRPAADEEDGVDDAGGEAGTAQA